MERTHTKNLCIILIHVKRLFPFVTLWCVACKSRTEEFGKEMDFYHFFERWEGVGSRNSFQPNKCPPSLHFYTHLWFFPSSLKNMNLWVWRGCFFLWCGTGQ
jgi:hypothetical protein